MLPKPKTRIKNPIPTSLFLLLTTGLLAPVFAGAQTKAIQFESGTWEEIKTRAANENKLIFLDAYATWCGPCKTMAKHVFTNDSVADYYNVHFINAKIDMEAGEGPGIAKRYNVNIYPTLLFVNAQGNVVHRAVGAYKPQQFIELGRDAQDPGKQSPDSEENDATGNAGVEPAIPDKLGITFNISQYQKDFGIGLNIISPYFIGRSIAMRAGVNVQWLETFNGTETNLITYRHIRLGTRGRSFLVNHNISVYGEGGVQIIVPGRDLSSKGVAIGGYGLFGFDFRISQRISYFIELGGLGGGATADKIINKPIYSSGFLTNVGMKIGF